METKFYIMNDEADTAAFGAKLAETLQAGDVVGLVGDLGTGKTALTKSIARALGVQELITSPTFTIVQEYHDGKLPLYHFDVYRIGDVEEMYEIGYEEYFFGKGVCIVEWADLIEEIMPEDGILIEIECGEEETQRRYVVRDGRKKA